jgi:hypothetical protein
MSPASTLEAWFRLLVDPEPIRSMGNDLMRSVRGPLNQVVLAQREAFLRPDSAAAIVMARHLQPLLIGRALRLLGAFARSRGPRRPMGRAFETG